MQRFMDPAGKAPSRRANSLLPLRSVRAFRHDRLRSFACTFQLSDTSMWRKMMCLPMKKMRTFGTVRRAGEIDELGRDMVAVAIERSRCLLRAVEQPDDLPRMGADPSKDDGEGEAGPFDQLARLGRASSRASADRARHQQARYPGKLLRHLVARRSATASGWLTTLPGRPRSSLRRFSRTRLVLLGLGDQIEDAAVA